MIEKILCVSDLWHNLKTTDKKIVLYGMGDGADKILDTCEKFGIEVSAVFASDGFKKNKIFRGFEVTDYAGIKERFSDFIVLLSFATSLPEVIDNIIGISGEAELYCPDVPVFGGGLFDSDFVKANFDKFKAVYEKLSDKKSKDNYINLILGKLTGNINYLISAETTVAEAYKAIIKPNNNSHYVDIGAYNGDTIREYLSFSGGCTKITAFEPDARNYRKLCAFANEAGLNDRASIYNIAAWNKRETHTFYSRSGRNSASTTSHKGLKAVEIRADRADAYIDCPVDFVNIDAEGSDRNVLLGLSETICKYKPTISCAVYHRNEDFFDLPLLLCELYGDCELYIRHFRYFPAWDTNIYIKKK